MSEEKSMFERNMDMWQKWTTTYMDTMSQAMERTMAQSETFQKQVNKAVATTVGAQFDAMLAGIRALEQQVEALSKKVDEMMPRE
jgi:hypothetical protein